jgi:CHAD domain-containing protein
MQNGQMDIREVLLGFLDMNEAVVKAKMKVLPSPDLELAVHQLRVATKKLRTVFRLLGFASERGFRHKREIEPLRTFFRAAGQLRELHVHAKVLNGFEEQHLAVYKRLQQLLADEQRFATQLYMKAKKQFKPKLLAEPISLARDWAWKLPKKELQAALSTMTLRRIREIELVMPSEYDPVLIHKGRILLKEAMYLIGLLHAAGQKEDFSDELLDHAKEAAELAGQWHDREAFWHWLKLQMRPGGPIKSTDPQYRLLLQDLQTQTKALVDDFRAALVPVLARLSEQVEAGQADA